VARHPAQDVRAAAADGRDLLLKDESPLHRAMPQQLDVLPARVAEVDGNALAAALSCRPEMPRLVSAARVPNGGAQRQRLLRLALGRQLAISARDVPRKLGARGPGTGGQGAVQRLITLGGARADLGLV
jgi:hypothetical protein